MTNFEKYKEELLSFDYAEGYSPAKKNDKLMRCADVHCIECDFFDGNCTTNFIKWLYENDDKAECCEDCAYFDTSTVRGSMCEVCNRNYSNQFKPKPKKTRQSEFLKKYPNARLNSKGILDIRPCNIDTSYSTNHCYFACGDECQNAYWLQEVDE